MDISNAIIRACFASFDDGRHFLVRACVMKSAPARRGRAGRSPDAHALRSGSAPCSLPHSVGSSMGASTFSLSLMMSTLCLLLNAFVTSMVSAIQIHAGKTQIWNRAGVVPPGHDAFLRAAQTVDLHAKLWCGDLDDPVSERGIKVLGTPLGHRACV